MVLQRILITLLFLSLSAAVATPHYTGNEHASKQRIADEIDLPKFVEKAIESHGGAGRLAKLKAQTWKAKGNYYVSGTDVKRPYIASFAFEAPNKLKAEYVGAFTIVTNEKKGWVNGEEMTTEQLAQQHESSYVGWVTSRFPLTDKGFSLAREKDQEIDGRPTVAIKVSHAGHRDFVIYFDKQTARMAKVVMKLLMPNGEESSQETVWSQYKVFDGIPVPTKFITHLDGKVLMDGEMTEWKGAESLDASLFELSSQAKEGQTDLDKLQGTWQLVEAVANGKKLSEEATKHFTICFSHNKMVSKNKDRITVDTTFTLQPEQNPKAIDIRIDGDTGRGLYELAGDSLKLIHGEAGKSRPGQFESKEGSQLTLMVLKRLSK